ncbi:MAG: hypothetical protein ABIZ04_25690 [Opitutus sp.]
MLFNSLTFFVFFALVLGGYWTLRSWEARKNLLLAANAAPTTRVDSVRFSRGC